MNQHVMDRHAARFSESLIVEPGLADFEHVPVFSLERFVDVNHIQITVLQGL